jgi:hypothetical protein
MIHAWLLRRIQWMMIQFFILNLFCVVRVIISTPKFIILLHTLDATLTMAAEVPSTFGLPLIAFASKLDSSAYLST